MRSFCWPCITAPLYRDSHNSKYCSVCDRRAPALPAGSPPHLERWQRTPAAGPCTHQPQTLLLWIREQGRLQYHHQRTALVRQVLAPWRLTQLLEIKGHSEDRAMLQQSAGSPSFAPHTHAPLQTACPYRTQPLPTTRRLALGSLPAHSYRGCRCKRTLTTTDTHGPPH